MLLSAHLPRLHSPGLQDSHGWPSSFSCPALVHPRIYAFSSSVEMGTSWSPSLTQKSVCVYVCVCVHIHIKNPESKRPSQIPCPEKGPREDVAPPPPLAIQVRQLRRREGEVCRGWEEVSHGSSRLDLRHQEYSVLSTLPPLPHSLPPANPPGPISA